MIFLWFIIGFAAQMIDGTLGMAYGVSCNTFLRSTGASPLIASSLVHFSEIFTSGMSAFSHFKFKNIDKSLFLKLLIPGVIGGIVGAAVLSEFGSYLEAVVSAYLILMGILLVVKAFRKKRNPKRIKNKFIYILAAAGGLLDATGGGGWGPVVTSTMLCRGEDVSKTIGTVNASEFFVTLAESAVFAASISEIWNYRQEFIFLVLGGVCAAPLAALVCKKINRNVLLAIVGVLVAALNIYNLYTAII